ncbi:ATP-binding protein [Thalassomonas sp. RHCl1]|uniref:ATP-binding protein n=1 Tax=Thalassomonas sp. RHCl1 TaxID=2995320 RepID=UPI00248C3162|nr:ATP-binding protein [Thalassomonas sp. RHCl1]
MLDKIIKEKLNFSVDGRLISELGEKLVTKNYLALGELIKNSYDADSENVEIKFNNVREGNGTIVVKDLGTGMLWEEVRDCWMRVSTSNKETSPVSLIYGRKKSGSKGIGRFACQKLAAAVNLKTVAITDDPNIAQVTTLDIEWEDFKLGKDLIEIKCKSEYYFTEKSNVTIGTTITLINLKQKWNQISYNSLQRQLASLSISSPVRREDFEEDPGFEILVSADEFESGNYKLSEKVLDASWGRVKGSVAEDGTVKLFFDGKLIGKKEHTLHEQFPILKHAEFDVSCLPHVKAYQRNPQLMNSKQMKIIEDTHPGIKVYSEGFRVYPYGQEGDDWLGLDRDVGRRKAKIDNNELGKIASSYGLDKSRVILDLFRNANIVGAVYIDTNINPAFEIKLNREGFVENEASLMLSKLLRYIVEWMTVQYSYFKVLFSEHELEQLRKDFDDKLGSNNSEVAENKIIYDEEPGGVIPKPPLSIDNKKEQFDKAMTLLLNEAKFNRETSNKSYLEDIAPERASDQSVATNKDSELLEVASKIITTEFNANKNELTLLRAIASSGPLFFVFAHEFKSLVSNLDTDAGNIEQWISKNSKNDTRWLSEIAKSMRLTRQRFLSLENLIGVFASTHKIKTKRIKVAQAIEKVCAGFEFVTSSSNIKIDTKGIDALLKTQEISDAAFYSIVVNLVSNAIKVVLAKGTREIRITAFRKNNLVMRVEDKGIGLPEDKWDDVFLPLVTDPTGEMYNELFDKVGTDELSVLGRGTGLGLNIVKGMVQDNGGRVKFIKPSDGWKTCVEVILP